jgi:hypothetical protein
MVEATSLSYSTLSPEPNSSYLSNYHHSSIADPISGSTMGLMMFLSTLQYQSPYMNPTYSNAANQIGKMSFVESGGQNLQDRFVSMVTKDGIDIVHSLGITDKEMGVFLGITKVVRERRISLTGPKIYSIGTSLTADPNSGNIGFKYDW